MVGGASGAAVGATAGRRAVTAGAAGAVTAGAVAAGGAAAGATGAVAAGRDGRRGGGVAAGAVSTSLAGRLVTSPDLAERVGSTDGRAAAAGAEIFPGSSAGISCVPAAAGLGLVSSGGRASGFVSAGSWTATGRRRLSRSALRRTRSA